MEVSVIIPTYERGRLLIECISSLIDQDFSENYEIIIVDDGSKNNIINSNILRNKKIKYVKIKHRGPASARNHGIEMARGKYIIFLGDDIIADRELIKAHYMFLEKESYNVSSLGNTLWHKSTPNFKFSKVLRLVGVEDTPPKNEEDCGFFSFKTSNIAIRRSWLLNERFDENFPYAAMEDNEIGYRLYKKGLRIKFNEKAVAYHVHEYTLSHLKKKAWETGYSIGYFLAKHPEISGYYLKYLNRKELLYISKILSKKVFFWLGFYHYVAISFYQKYLGLKKFREQFWPPIQRQQYNIIRRIITILQKDFNNKHRNYIFFITSKCNLHCPFCLYSDNLNLSQDLPIEKIKDLFSRIGEISNLLLSGGEPFLREDMVEILKFIIENNKVKHLTIPTNGMNTEQIIKKVKVLVESYPLIGINISVSIDAREKLHDELRGVKGVYKNAFRTIKQLSDLSKKYPNLNINISTVIMPENIYEIKNLINDLKKLELVNYTYSAEVVRPRRIDYYDYPVFNDLLHLRQVYDEVLKFKEEIYSKKLHFSKIWKFILCALHYANIYSIYKIQFDYITKKKNWPVKCCAGLDMNVIYSNGDLSICELRKPICNIKDVSKNVNLNKLFESQRNKVKNCYCTHLCYILPSIYSSKKMIFFVLPLRMLRYLLVKMKLLNYF